MMNEEEYAEDFKSNFPGLDLEVLDLQDREAFLKNTKKYCLAVINRFCDYIDLDTSIFKDLQILNIHEDRKSDPVIWRSLANRFSNLFENKHDEFKQELSDFLSMDHSSIDKSHCVLQWKRIKEMQHRDKPRFFRLLQLVEGLLTIPYSNAPIERAFSQLKLIKTNKRLRLKKKNLASFMILKDITRKTKIEEFRSILNPNHLKKVKLTIDETIKKQNHNQRKKKLDVDDFVINN